MTAAATEIVKRLREAADASEGKPVRLPDGVPYINVTALFRSAADRIEALLDEEDVLRTELRFDQRRAVDAEEECTTLRARLDEMGKAAGEELGSIHGAFADRGMPLSTDERPFGVTVGEAVDALVAAAYEAAAARASQSAEDYDPEYTEARIRSLTPAAARQVFDAAIARARDAGRTDQDNLHAPALARLAAIEKAFEIAVGALAPQPTADGDWICACCGSGVDGESVACADIDCEIAEAHRTLLPAPAPTSGGDDYTCMQCRRAVPKNAPCPHCELHTPAAPETAKGDVICRDCNGRSVPLSDMACGICGSDDVYHAESVRP